MRTRRFTAMLSGCVLMLVLSGCGGNEAGPAPGRPAQDPGPDALPVKLTALTADQCFLTPAQQVAKGCEKYVTELGNTAAQVRKRAGDRDPRLTELAGKLDKFVGDYRATGCTTVTARGSGPCAQALSGMAKALGEIRAAVNNQATTS